MSCAIGGEGDSSLVDNDLLLVRSGSRGCRECREVDSSVVDVGGLLVAGTVASDVDGGTDCVTFVVVGGLELGPVLMLSNVDSAGAVGGLLMMRRRVVMMRLFERWFGKIVTTEGISWVRYTRRKQQRTTTTAPNRGLERAGARKGDLVQCFFPLTPLIVSGPWS